MFRLEKCIDKTAWIAPGAVIAGENVKIGRDCTVWYNAVIRCDFTEITIGDETNIQDNCVIHGRKPVTLGNNVSIGHGAIVHGATVEDNSLVGMNAVVMDGVVIGKNSLVAAGSVVTEGKTFPPGSLIVGCPAKLVRPLTEEEQESIFENSKTYLKMREIHMK